MTIILTLGWVCLIVYAIHNRIKQNHDKNRTPYFPKTKEDTLKELDWHQRHLKAAYDSGDVPKEDYIKNINLISRLRQEAEHQH